MAYGVYLMLRLRRIAAHLRSNGALSCVTGGTVSGHLKQMDSEPNSDCRRRRLSDEELERFAHDGFLVVHGLFAPSELQGVRDIVARWMGEVAQELVQLGALSSSFSELDIEARLARMEEEVPGCALHMQSAFMRDRKLGANSVWSLPELRTLRSDPRLLDIFEQILGSPEIAAHPNVVLRCRAPTPTHGADGGRVPW